MITKIFATLTLALSMPAFAVWAPDWERPLEVAQMEVLKSDGAFKDMPSAELTLNRRDGSDVMFTSLSLAYVALGADGQNVNVTHTAPVQDLSFNRCGGMQIKTRLKLYDPALATGYYPELEIILSRMQSEAGVACVDPEMPHGEGWTATVRLIESGSVNSVSSIDLKGFPEPLMTIQSLLE